MYHQYSPEKTQEDISSAKGSPNVLSESIGSLRSQLNPIDIPHEIDDSSFERALTEAFEHGFSYEQGLSSDDMDSSKSIDSFDCLSIASLIQPKEDFSDIQMGYDSVTRALPTRAPSESNNNLKIKSK